MSDDKFELTIADTKKRSATRLTIEIFIKKINFKKFQNILNISNIEKRQFPIIKSKF